MLLRKMRDVKACNRQRHVFLRSIHVSNGYKCFRALLLLVQCNQHAQFLCNRFRCAHDLKFFLHGFRKVLSFQFHLIFTFGFVSIYVKLKILLLCFFSLYLSPLRSSFSIYLAFFARACERIQQLINFHHLLIVIHIQFNTTCSTRKSVYAYKEAKTHPHAHCSKNTKQHKIIVENNSNRCICTQQKRLDKHRLELDFVLYCVLLRKCAYFK